MWILVITHTFACLFYYIGHANLSNHDDNWLTVYNLSDLHTAEIYINSIYFIIISMITVGFGDIAPIN